MHCLVPRFRGVGVSPCWEDCPGEEQAEPGEGEVGGEATNKADPIQRSDYEVSRISYGMSVGGGKTGNTLYLNVTYTLILLDL